ncbi:hypothetical protein ABZ249_06220 [Nocardiopsis sp. NPDC006139]|uniref:hypothetical protein n=1 Tax=Nocardiopsis sp. NPDC006139 TaxID=3154578 RepID=UPI0033ACDB82
MRHTAAALRRHRAFPVLLVLAAVLHLLCAAGHGTPEGPVAQTSSLWFSERSEDPSSATHGDTCEDHHKGGTELGTSQERGPHDHAFPPLTVPVVAALDVDPWPSVPTYAVRGHNTRRMRRRRTGDPPQSALCVWRI